MSTEIQRVFQHIMERFDTDSDAIITQSEFNDALVTEGIDGPTASEITNQIFQNWDRNHDMLLTYDEVQTLSETWASFPGDQSRAL